MINAIELEQGKVVQINKGTLYIKSYLKQDVLYRAERIDENVGDEVLYAVLLNGEAAVIKTL